MPRGCVACRRDELSFFGKRLTYDYYICDGCGTLQLFPMPSDADLREAYAREYAESSDAMHGHAALDPATLNRDHERYHRGLVEAVQDCGAAGPILEVGCGFGGLGQQALRAGLTWEGIDYSEQAVEYCRKAGMPVSRDELSEKQSQYAAIVMCFVFEHLSSHDDFLATCRRLLLPKGKIITLHPTAPSAQLFATIARLGNRQRALPPLDSAFAPPWHTTLFSLKGMREVAARNKFSIERVQPSPTGRFGGAVRRAAQVSVEWTNRIGWSVAGERWPLIPAHLFVIQMQ